MCQTMNLPEETTSVLFKNTVQYLHDVAERVPNTLRVLKSYYALKFRISELQTKITLEKNKNKSDARCPKCCLKLRETDSSYSVKPELKKSKFARKLVKKVQANKRLTKFQADYLKKNDLKEGNKLIITCNFCQNKVVYNCSKPVKPRVDDNSNERLPIVDRNKKKRKKNDKFAGLHQGAVLTVQENLNKKGEQKQLLNKKKKKNDKSAGLQQKAVLTVQQNLNKRGEQKQLLNKNRNEKNKSKKGNAVSVHKNSVKNGNQTETETKVSKNPISKKKEKQKQKKVRNKLRSIMLNDSNLNPSFKNNLSLFLQSFNK